MRFCQNCIFEVGWHDFSIINPPILLKFCTLLLDKIASWLNEWLFFLWIQLILQANTWPNFYRKLYCFAYSSVKHSNFNFFKILRSITSYTHLLTEKIWFFLFWIKLLRVILVSARILFSKVFPKTSSQRVNFQYFFIKSLWNFVEMLFFHMPEVGIK